MAKRKTDKTEKVEPTGQAHGKDINSWKPGSEPERAKDVGGAGDFGVPAGSGSTRDRDYVSENTKMSDPGAAQPFDWEHDGVRDHGAGARDSGPGSSSAGDMDTDIIGVGTGGSGVAASAPGEKPGPDDSDGTSNEFGSKLPPVDPRRAKVEPAQGHVPAGGTVARGSFVQGQRLQTGPPAQGADAATNPEARDDDSFMGEVSSGEAQGQDLGMSPSSDTQGLSQEDDQADQKDFPDEG